MKKSLIWLTSILSVIVVFVILIFTVFTLKSAEVKFHNNTVLFSAQNAKSDIIESAKLDFGHTLFFMNKTSYVNNIEKAFPYLEVVNIESVFPSKLVLHLNEREPVFAVKAESKYFICDASLKILQITENFESTQNNPILINPLTEVSNNLVAGDFLEIPETNALKQISPAMELTNRNIKMQMSLFKTVNVIETVDVADPLEQTKFGLEIFAFNSTKAVITVAEKNLGYKLNMLMALLSENIDPSMQYFYIYENLEGEIEAIKKNYN